jgi:golgin subfamily B member 1
MAEGNETPGGDPNDRRAGARSEGDLLAERRARRAAETGEAALTRRAEAAEATVQTLERHVASLQQRLREAEQELQGTGELVEAEKALALEREHELRRVKQREYAEQQLRVEAEDRLISLERESHAEIEQLSGRLSASEREAHALATRLESIQRQLAEAEQAAAAERAALRRSEHELQARLRALERSAVEIQRGLEVERGARERSERLLEAMRDGTRQLEGLVGDLKAIIARLLLAGRGASRPDVGTPAATQAGLPSTEAGLAVTQQAPEREGPTPGEIGRRQPTSTPLPAASETRGVEMVDALAAAVERLRQRAEAAVATPVQPRWAPPSRPSHKHSLSLLGRWRLRRKQRRAR